ncbi:hypothetical protein [Streptomyces sp. MMS24-I29]|uniref:hypothetical protein n=1 Tax=Streptomyces sp. MMS24-I29 TaxID=3351480 RepID=UPI003C7ADD74
MSTASLSPYLLSLSAMKEKAEDVAAQAKHLADTLRAEYARQLLRDAFPGHTRAVFTRDFNEDEPAPTRLLSADDETAALDLSKEAEDYSALTPELKQAVVDAELQIVQIGSDIDILEHLDPGEVEYDDGVDFTLDLTTEATA